MSHLASVVIREFNIVCVSIFKSETYAPLVVDGNRVLPLSFPLQFMKSITWRHFQILQPGREIEILQPPHCSFSNIRRKPFRLPRFVQLQCLLIRKRLNHALIVICHVTHVNNPKVQTLGTRRSCGYAVSASLACFRYPSAPDFSNASIATEIYFSVSSVFPLVLYSRPNPRDAWPRIPIAPI